MPKYKTQPYTVEAVQFKGEESLEEIKELCRKYGHDRSEIFIDEEGTLIVQTVYDFKYVYAGDYLVAANNVLMVDDKHRFELNFKLV